MAGMMWSGSDVARLTWVWWGVARKNEMEDEEIV